MDSANQPLPVGGPDGTLPDLRGRVAASGDDVLTPAYFRVIMQDCCRFLWQLTRITTSVLDTVTIGQLRAIVAAEIPVPPNVVDDAGRLVEKIDTGRDHRVEPRGRKHPLLTLIQYTVQGIRLLIQILTKDLADHTNLQTAEDKRALDELKEREREFSRMLQGKI